VLYLGLGFLVQGFQFCLSLVEALALLRELRIRGSEFLTLLLLLLQIMLVLLHGLILKDFVLLLGLRKYFLELLLIHVLIG
jgi:hypothetical protein